jgi:hypothetical protein
MNYSEVRKRESEMPKPPGLSLFHSKSNIAFGYAG